jgi:hypothetical protein
MPRSVSGALALALPSGGLELSRADTFDFTLSDGATLYHWTSWRQDLVIDGITFSSADKFPLFRLLVVLDHAGDYRSEVKPPVKTALYHAIHIEICML